VVTPQHCICLAGEIFKEDKRWDRRVRTAVMVQYLVQNFVTLLGQFAFVWATVLLAAFSSFMNISTLLIVVLTLLLEASRQFSLGALRRPRTAEPLVLGPSGEESPGGGIFRGRNPRCFLDLRGRNLYPIESLYSYIVTFIIVVSKVIVLAVFTARIRHHPFEPNPAPAIDINTLLLIYYSVCLAQGGLHIIFFELFGWSCVYWFPIRFLKAYYYLLYNAVAPPKDVEGWVLILKGRPFDDVESLEKQMANLSLLWLGCGKELKGETGTLADVHQEDISKMSPGFISDKLNPEGVEWTDCSSNLGSYNKKKLWDDWGRIASGDTIKKSFGGIPGV
jgi:hypothetical protein